MGDLVAPLGCSAGASGCYAAGCNLGYAGSFAAALNYGFLGFLATGCALVSLYNSLDEDGIRCQHFFTPEEDAQKLSALRKAFENAYKHHDDLQNLFFTEKTEGHAK